MTLSIEIPTALEDSLRSITDLPERVQQFLRHQASLEEWREKRRDPLITRLRESVYEAARSLQGLQVPREVIGEQLLYAYDQLCRHSSSHE